MCSRTACTRSRPVTIKIQGLGISGYTSMQRQMSTWCRCYNKFRYFKVQTRTVILYRTAYELLEYKFNINSLHFAHWLQVSDWVSDCQGIKAKAKASSLQGQLGQGKTSSRPRPRPRFFVRESSSKSRTFFDRVLAKDSYCEISEYFGIPTVEQLIINRHDRFFNRFRSQVNYVCQALIM